MYSLRSPGFAVFTVTLLLLMITAVSTGMIYMVHSEMRSSQMDSEDGQSFYAAQAAMEKMAADLDYLYSTTRVPTMAQVQQLAENPPGLTLITFPEYAFEVPSQGGYPQSRIENITAGSFQGLMSEKIPLTLTASAHRITGAETRMSRLVEIVLIPVFQFGIFSETDLSYHPGPGFDFGGRVHTNGNLFLAASSSSGLTFHSKVSAVGEVIRAETINGRDTAADGRNGPIYIPTAPNGCDGARPACRALAMDEGSRVTGPDSPKNPNWDNLSVSVYNGMVVSGSTGAKPLELPFVNDELRPIEIVRRPLDGGDPDALVDQSRLYTRAQIRVLLSDDPGDLPGGPIDPDNIHLANDGPYTGGVEVAGVGTTYFAEGNTGEDADWVAPGQASDWPLLDGWLRVEAKTDSGYRAVTREWLQLGFARGLATPDSEAGIPNTAHPDAILIFQQQADRNMDGDLNDAGETTQVTGEAQRHHWFPVNLYDPREGEIRDQSLGENNRSCAIGGVMNAVELDVRNLRRWLLGEIGTSGTLTESVSENGYVFYFSDRRGMLSPPGQPMVGEYGFEDVVNPNSASGEPNGFLEEGEDVNHNGFLDTHGEVNLGDAFFPNAQGGLTSWDAPITRIDCPTVGRKNRVTGARHALKLINGTLGNLPSRSDGTGGFTVVAENPVYVRGNYNASNGFSNANVPAAILADAVTLLSASWEDDSSFKHPTYVGSQTARKASSTWYRMAVAAGKSLPYSNPSWAGKELGMDGGTHNFLRYLERWRGQTLHYKGSLVSFYNSVYAVGQYKCCRTVYTPPARDYSFDVNFVQVSKLPPGTPRFQDVVIHEFQHLTDAAFEAPANPGSVIPNP